MTHGTPVTWHRPERQPDGSYTRYDIPCIVVKPGRTFVQVEMWEGRKRVLRHARPEHLTVRTQ